MSEISLWGIFPQFGDISRDERDYWAYQLSKEFESLQEKYRISKPRFIQLYPANSIPIENIQIDFPRTVSKGIAVRLSLFAILDWIDDHKGPKGRSSTWIVMVDGTGAYVNQAESVINGLNKHSLVLGKRQGPYWGMPERRKQIEIFEKTLLERKFALAEPLPDCQAGIWGMHASMLEVLPLTASEYELEFDLAVAGITALNRQPDFVDVVANPDRASSSVSTPGDHPTLTQSELKMSMDKLRCIINRIHLSPDDIRDALNETTSLPHDYRREVEKIVRQDDPFRPFWRENL